MECGHATHANANVVGPCGVAVKGLSHCASPEFMNIEALAQCIHMDVS